ncbi:MAG: adenylyltransferase/cytidyltransferase family protein [archaeon]|nr:adenylyltransferase/cytidyltransferase family protein [archaeon]
MITGYTAGVYDLFHIGHVNLFKSAKGMCDRLVVGVTTDELVSYKNKQAAVPYEERKAIVESIRYVDQVVPQDNMDKLSACKKVGATVMFVGDDWYGTEKWEAYEKEFAENGIRIIYFPYTKRVSSTVIAEKLGISRDISADK